MAFEGGAVLAGELFAGEAAADVGFGALSSGAFADAAAGGAFAAGGGATAGSALADVGFGGAFAGGAGAAGGALAGDALATSMGSGIGDAFPAASAETPTATANYLPVTGSGPSAMGTLSPDIAAGFGITPEASPAGLYSGDITGGAGLPGGGGLSFGGDAGGAAGFNIDPNFLSPEAAPGGAPAGGDGGFFDSAGKWVAGHQAQAGLLGLSVLRGAFPQQLPGAAKTALGSSTQAVQQAQSVIASGGTSSPQWQQQKSSIDASVDQKLQQAIAQMQQSAGNAGMGGANSGVVQQQIARMKSEAETQRQQLYSQALNQIISSAVSMLSGGNATLGSIAQMQMGQSQQAQSAASQTAELALLLERGGG